MRQCIADAEHEKHNKGMTEMAFLFLVQLPQSKPRRRIKASRWNRFDRVSNDSSEALSWIEFKEELRSQEVELADCTKWVWHEEFSHSEQKPGINNFGLEIPTQKCTSLQIKVHPVVPLFYSCPFWVFNLKAYIMQFDTQHTPSFELGQFTHIS